MAVAVALTVHLNAQLFHLVFFVSVLGEQLKPTLTNAYVFISISCTSDVVCMACIFIFLSFPLYKQKQEAGLGGKGGQFAVSVSDVFLA